MNMCRVAVNVVVAAIDFSEIAPLVVRGTIEAARKMNAGQIHFVHVQPGQENAPSRARQCEELGAWLEKLLRSNEPLSPGTQVLVHEANGEPARCIVELADKLRAGCILVGARACDGGSTRLGSVAKAVVRDAACPVLVMRPQGKSPRASASNAPALA